MLVRVGPDPAVTSRIAVDHLPAHVLRLGR